MKPQTNRTTEPPSVNGDGSRSPGKSNPLQTRFILISMARLSVEEDDTIMTTMYSKFGFDGDFFVRNLDASVGSASTSRFHKGIFFLFLTEWHPFFLLKACFFFFFLIFSHGLSSAFDFSTSKDFSMNKELPRLNFGKCAISKNMEIR